MEKSGFRLLFFRQDNMITHNNFHIGDFDFFSSNFRSDSIKIFRKSKEIFYLPKNILVKKLAESTVVFHAPQAV